MGDPPPYSRADTPFSLTCLPQYIDHRDYPKLCLVCSTWRDVFQSLIWSQPDRYFSTENRSVNTGFQKFVQAFYSVRKQLLGHIIYLSLHEVAESVYISLPVDFLAQLLSSARYLRSLDLSPGFLVGYGHIAAVKTFHTELRTSNLAGVQAFSPTTLSQFLSLFPHLKRLDLSGTSGVTPNLFSTLSQLRYLTAVRLRHQPFKITHTTVTTLAKTLESNLADLDLSFALKSISGSTITALERYCLARPPNYSSTAESVDIGPGPRRLGVAYTSVPIASIARFLSLDMIHLLSLDVAGCPNLPNSSVEFWESLRRGGTFSTLQLLRMDFSVYTANAGFNISVLPPRLQEFTLHNVPPVESSPPRVTRTLTMLFGDLRTTNPFLKGVLKVVNLEMAPKGDEQEVGMYGIEERDTGDEIDVIEEIKRWKRGLKHVWEGQIRVVRDVVGVRGYAQEFGSGVGDILGRWEQD